MELPQIFLRQFLVRRPKQRNVGYISSREAESSLLDMRGEPGKFETLYREQKVPGVKQYLKLLLRERQGAESVWCRVKDMGIRKARKSMKILYGTGNPAKLEAMKRRLSGFCVELVGLKDMEGKLPEIVEDGKTPLENARKKALAYYAAFQIPVFSCDSGLYLDGVPESEQPGVHVRTVGGKYLTDEEMLAHYSSLAKKYGNLTARYRNAICLVMGEGAVYEAMEESMASEPFLLVPEPHEKRKEGFPLDSISVDLRTGKYYYDLVDGELDQVAVEDGFLEFFHKHLGSV